VCLILAPLHLAAAEPAKVEKLDARALAARIDSHIDAKWKANKVKPTLPADDAEFLRRVYLDLIGRIPRVSEIHAFVDDKDAHKREKKVEELLNSAGYSTHFSNFWRGVMVPPSTDQFAFNFAPQMEQWLNRRLKDNMPYDQMVREVLAAPLGVRNQRPQPGQQRVAIDPSVLAFFQANENKPETIASASSRIFMGIRLECAQCHDHPFNQYTRQQFWEFAAFFGGIKTTGPMPQFQQPQDDPRVREIKMPSTDKTVKAKFLDGSEPKWDEDNDKVNARQTLAAWLTTANNPYFARAAANRLFAYFLGIGIVDPVDEPSDDNPPSHPELLNELAAQFALNGFDLKYLIKAITLSKTYQLSSLQTDSTQTDPRLFGRVSVKGMSPEQLYDSIVLATGYRDPNFQNRRFQNRAFNQGAEFEFRTRFSNFSDKRTEYQTSILQALSMMNGAFMTEVTSPTKSFTLGSVVDAPFMSTEDKLDALYLAALGRPLRSQEKVRLIKYVESGGPAKDEGKALSDVFWALLNSSEFMFNH